MKLTERIRDDIAVVYPEGNLDIHAVLVLEEIFNIAMEDNPGCNILVDLHDAGHISSSCLRILVAVHTALEKKGLKLVLFDPNTINRKVLDLTEISNFIKVCDTLEQAIGSVKQ